MSIVKVGLLQMRGCGYDKGASLAKGDAFCRRAKMMGVDIALFPEMWSTGMKFFNPELPGEDELWRAQAITRDDPYIVHFRNLAEESNMAIALTYLEKWEDCPRNTVSLIDRHGEIVLTYAKVHTCEFSSECALT
ncbi:MAG TPA: carbon-nitrogen hydrolase family protein, partial [Blastocatellia bacterium]